MLGGTGADGALLLQRKAPEQGGWVLGCFLCLSKNNPKQTMLSGKMPSGRFPRLELRSIWVFYLDVLP